MRKIKESRNSRPEISVRLKEGGGGGGAADLPQHPNFLEFNMADMRAETFTNPKKTSTMTSTRTAE